MKLYFEDDKGNRFVVEKAANLSHGDIILFLDRCYHEEDLERMETSMAKKFGRKVIILDGRYRDIAVVPPV